MQTLSEIRSLLEASGLAPRKRLGQNFLHDQNHVRRLIAAANLSPGDRVLEVGPGTGTLTEALLDAGAEVVACELDEGLADLVADRLGDRITLVRGDCLGRHRRLADAVVEALGDSPWTLVANLPYQAASPLMIELLLHHPNCQGQHVTIQREVADRLVAAPGTRERGPLGIIASVFGRIERIGDVPPSCFWPQPKVTSAMISIEPLTVSSPVDRDRFATFVTTLFSSRRKQLGRIFGRDRTWPDGIDPTWRPEVLTNEQLLALFDEC
ncbi:MAG: 16S rRNA (adenine(1518)-N(6)/adenine(1519)-N(6))-dimethyltransferase RsmA [Phycisphaerales bacterium]|nr:16S rRNA (adenine(1518)-N(6)/adenine(1519)-N(6))-dimethyltransferase RsmA [Phycisphaerales bacterium]